MESGEIIKNTFLQLSLQVTFSTIIKTIDQSFQDRFQNKNSLITEDMAV